MVLAHKISDGYRNPYSQVQEPLEIAVAHARIGDMAQAQAMAGDISGAQKTAGLIADNGSILSGISDYRLKSGDLAGALKAANLIQSAETKIATLSAIAIVRAEAGDLSGAQDIINKMVVEDDSMPQASYKGSAQQAIIKALARRGDLAGVQTAVKRMTFIEEADERPYVLEDAKTYIASAGATIAARTLVRPETLSWLQMLDNTYDQEQCPLNTDLFLDMPKHLKSLPQSDETLDIFIPLRDFSSKVVHAMMTIDAMLQKQAIR